MRTTLTLDDDVAIQLEQLRRGGRLSLKQLVNEALRQGLRQLAEPKARREPYRIKPFDPGEPFFPIDNIAEVLAIAEGDDHR